MRYPRRRTARRGAYGGGQDFWLSFSDLMSVLVLVFILVLFYILYKYFIINTAMKQAGGDAGHRSRAQDEGDQAHHRPKSPCGGEDLLLAQGELTQAQESLRAAASLSLASRHG